MSRSDRQLPPEAKKVFQGLFFEVWQWPQKMFDGSIATFERIKRPDTVVMIAVVGDKILIQDQEQPSKPPFISLPGGRLEKDEDSLDGAKRELLEETGYVSDDWELWFVAKSPSYHILWQGYTYIARNCHYQQDLQLDNGEKITNRLITFDELLSLPDNPKFAEFSVTEKLLRARFIAEERQKLEQLLYKIRS